MRQRYYRLLGLTRLTLMGAKPAAFLNAAGKRNLNFLEFTVQEPETLSFLIPRSQTEAACRAAAETGALIREKHSFGFLVFLRRMLQRRTLTAGMLLAILLAWLSACFLWQIQVEGNDAVSEDSILSALAAEGVRPGAFRFGLDRQKITERVRASVPELSYLSLNIQGCKATVLVREETKMPAVYDASDPVLLYALQDGVIEEVTVLNGKSLCSQGDTVKAGDILVTGRLESEASPVRFVHAIGEVRAATTRVLSAVMVTAGTGGTGNCRTKQENTVIFCQNRWNLDFHTGIFRGNCDKMIVREDVSLFGTELPLSIERTTVSQWELCRTEWETQRAEKALREFLLSRLQRELGETGTVRHTEFSTVPGDNSVTVVLTAECSENIAEERSMTADEMTAKTYGKKNDYD